MKLKKAFVGLTVIAIIAGAGIATFLLIATKPESKKNLNSTSVLGVKTIVAEPANYSVDMTYPGRVAAREIVTLTSEVTGKILPSQVALKVGERFKKGDVIVNILDAAVRASHNALISQFLNTLSNTLPDLKVDFPDQYDKWYSFFSEVDIDKKLPELPSINSDKEKVYISNKDIFSSYYNLLQNEIILSRYQIIAPFNGVYSSVAKEVGDIATANSEIAKIISTDRLELVVGVSLADAQKLSEGTVVDVVSQAGKVYKGSIDRIAPFVNQSTQSINVYVLFSEPSLEIVEGQMLNLTMPSVALEDVIEINREAIVGDSIVYGVQNALLKSVKVEVVANTPTRSYLRGITAGDTIVGESLVSPYVGMPVRKLDMNGVPVQ